MQRTAVSNGETSTWSYKYWLRTGLPSNNVGVPCSTCHQGYTWGNQNDNDYADYYNGTFESFYKVQVTQPDQSYQAHIFGATTGWGLATSSIHCYIASCVVASYFQDNTSVSPTLTATAQAGKEQEEHDYDANGNLLKVHIWGYNSHCPPQGVSNSGNNGNDPTSNPGQTQLISELDQNNPVVVCDPRVVQEDLYDIEGVSTLQNYATNANVVHETIVYDHDLGGSYDYGNLSRTDKSGNDVGGNHFVTRTWFYPHDDLGGAKIYLTDLPAVTQVQDGSGNPYSCSQTLYSGNSNPTTAPTLPDATSQQDHLTAGSSGCGSTTNLISLQHTYDSYGNAITAIDGDNHLGCTSGSSTYSACAVYDSTKTHLVSATNAQNQTTTYGYDSTAAGGYGQWLVSTTDPNSQVVSYQYDILGRLTAIIKPGDSSSSPSVTYIYTNNCSNGSTTPCLELDTATRFTVGGPVSTMKQWYDGWGHLVETQTPSPTSGQTIVTYTVYYNDSTNGNKVVSSLPYAVATPSGYLAPDLTKARSVTKSDSLGRSLGSVTYSDATTVVLSSSLAYSVSQGVTGFSSESSTPYARTTSLDAYNHESISYTDALGRTRYTQLFSGTSSPYSVIRTVKRSYDYLGNTTQVQTYDSGAALQATYSASYDALSRLSGFNDSDLGSCTNTPLPAGCATSTDLAWKFTYDADGNQLSQVDPRNKSTYTSYDLLDRPLCRSVQSTPCSNSPYALFFYDSYNNTSNPGQTFPSGCTAPGVSDPVGHTTAEVFSNSVGSGWRCSGYDARGEVTQSGLSVTADSTTTTQTMQMSYNDGGEVTQLTYPDGEQLTFTYDVNGRFQTAYFGTSSTPDPVQFLVGQTSYTSAGLLSGLALGGSGPKTGTPTPILSTSYSYDGIQRASSISATETTQPFWSQARTYDNVGNVLQLSTTVPASGGGTKQDNESFCYDALSRLVWAGNTGTPTGGDHCGSAPAGTATSTYQQTPTYDSLDRLTSGSAGTETYGDPSHLHATTSLSSEPNPYAAYDAMGNMTCRNADTTSSHTCGGSTPTGAAMTYDNEGRLLTWTAPSGSSDTEGFLYDNEGNRVLQHASTSSGLTDTLYFGGYTETVIHAGTTTTTKYYSAAGQRVALRIGSGVSNLDYLLPDLLGGTAVALSSSGTILAAQLYLPYGTTGYSWGTMPTSYNYTGQRLDGETGLLYYGFRYYDPVSGRFVRADTKENNASGLDPYGYVGGDPETKNDPTGHDGCGFWCMATGVLAVVAGAVAVAGIVTIAVATAPVSIAVGVIALGVAGGIMGGMAGSYINYEIDHPGTSSDDEEMNRAIFKGGIVGGIIGGLTTTCAVAFAACGGAGIAAMTYGTATTMGPGLFLANILLSGATTGLFNGVADKVFGAEMPTYELAAAQEKDPARRSMEAWQAKEHAAFISRLRTMQHNIQYFQRGYGNNWSSRYNYATFIVAIVAGAADSGAPVRMGNMNIS